MGEATISEYPGRGRRRATRAWWEREGAALGKAVIDGDLKLIILQASGLLVDLSNVRNVHDALDARSADYAVFCPMPEGPGKPELVGKLQEKLAMSGSQVVLVDRARLATAWRGHGGVGRLLTARLLRWVCPGARAVAPHALPDRPQREAAGGRSRL